MLQPSPMMIAKASTIIAQSRSISSKIIPRCSPGGVYLKIRKKCSQIYLSMMLNRILTKSNYKIKFIWVQTINLRTRSATFSCPSSAGSTSCKNIDWKCKYKYSNNRRVKQNWNKDSNVSKKWSPFSSLLLVLIIASYNHITEIGSLNELNGISFRNMELLLST